MSKIRQVQIGSWWGMAKLLLQHVTPYIQYIILMFTGITAYDALFKWLAERGFILPWWLFIVAIGVFFILACLFEWAISFPSFFGVWNHQIWEHDNPLRKEIEHLKKQNEELMAMLRELKK